MAHDARPVRSNHRASGADVAATHTLDHGARQPSSGRIAPPDLASEVWARDLQEVRALGGKNSTVRTAAQTEIARFWDETRPLVYYPILRAVAQMPDRSVSQNARFYASAAMAADDALIACSMQSTPTTSGAPSPALRIEHMAGGSKSEADPTWTPFIATPMHPE